MTKIDKSKLIGGRCTNCDKPTNNTCDDCGVPLCDVCYDICEKCDAKLCAECFDAHNNGECPNDGD